MQRKEKKLNLSRVIYIVFCMAVIAISYPMGHRAVIRKTNTAPLKTVSLSSPNLGSGELDINKASREDFMRIRGIGEKTADKIIAARNEMGGFRSIDDLVYADGIGYRKLESFKNYIKVGK